MPHITNSTPDTAAAGTSTGDQRANTTEQLRQTAETKAAAAREQHTATSLREQLLRADQDRHLLEQYILNDLYNDPDCYATSPSQRSNLADYTNAYQTATFANARTLAAQHNTTRQRAAAILQEHHNSCLLYTSPSPRD